MSSLADLVYLPRPGDIRTLPGTFSPTPVTSICITGAAPALVPSALRLQAAGLEHMKMRWAVRAGKDGEKPIVLSAGDSSLPAQGYRLTIEPRGVSVAGADPAGLSYGVSTLIQVLRQCDGPLPAGEMVDAPDFPVRGVMIDISRDKVPTLATLFTTVNLLAEMKINHLELYTEHTFAYSAHRRSGQTRAR